jgi:SAM-dependent methyltransferase
MANQLNLSEFANRPIPPAPWSEGQKIPWDDPYFSEQMLKEHLSQDHDMASRRSEIIERHVEIISTFLPGKNSQVLDLGCGPGLYCQRLALEGHRCTGIDISPASIDYARRQASSNHLDIDYIHQDIRTSEFPKNQDLAMMLFGEFNVFKTDDALFVLKKACEALKDTGVLIIEPSTFDGIYGLGHAPSSWQARPSGLFCASPHIWLYEAFWDEHSNTATERHCIISENVNAVQVYASSSQAYRDEELIDLVKTAGFKTVDLSDWESFGLAASLPGFQLVIARR